MNKRMNLLGTFLTGALAVAVAVYLAMHSFAFFTFVFGDANEFQTYLAFALTGGGFIVYLLKFKYASITPLQKVVSFAMVLICGIGELATAGFGFQVESYAKLGIVFTQEDIDFMISAIKILALVHGVALVMDFAGDEVISFFKNDDEVIPAPSVFHRKESDSFTKPPAGG